MRPAPIQTRPQRPVQGARAGASPALRLASPRSEARLAQRPGARSPAGPGSPGSPGNPWSPRSPGSPGALCLEVLPEAARGEARAGARREAKVSFFPGAGQATPHSPMSPAGGALCLEILQSPCARTP
eukprot:CAMPEP_0168453694 /NCGR_PEP_ID=MMETSP0228-20121227/49823_1 /TAXON_ID=133427 /ORGANISM="Protoceratium reticulatum, Strain CCCM 535 (=CCMP 1889)" /LENGTH=127 /DNA_ID=CAMNT_0008468429 /DNA_START=14 /DNA_END=394 /DNA_ORIENTATION=+